MNQLNISAHYPKGQDFIHSRFDEDGFLIDPSVWTKTLAKQLAMQSDLHDLSTKHWEVIEIVRERYFSMGALPVMRLICKAAGIEPDQAHHLFSSCKSLWQIAGLPNPGDEVISYMN